MNYRVVWDFDALQGLQRLYEAISDQELLIQVVERIALELGADPQRAGESRDSGKRVLFKFPLVVFFRIDERMKEVVITQVRATRR